MLPGWLSLIHLSHQPLPHLLSAPIRLLQKQQAQLSPEYHPKALDQQPDQALHQRPGLLSLRRIGWQFRSRENRNIADEKSCRYANACRRIYLVYQ